METIRAWVWALLGGVIRCDYSVQWYQEILEREQRCS